MRAGQWFCWRISYAPDVLYTWYFAYIRRANSTHSPTQTHTRTWRIFGGAAFEGCGRVALLIARTEFGVSRAATCIRLSGYRNAALSQPSCVLWAKRDERTKKKHAIVVGRVFAVWSSSSCQLNREPRRLSALAARARGCELDICAYILNTYMARNWRRWWWMERRASRRDCDDEVNRAPN